MKKKLLSLLVSGLILVSIVLGVTYYSYAQRCNGIKEYNPAYDRHFILDIFKKDWHWLVSEYSTDFSPEYMLDNKASSRDFEHVGNLNIKVYRLNCKPIGFTAYYLKSFYLGFILFLSVEEQYRRSGYAFKLIDYAVTDLFNQGCSAIQLITRVSNVKAQSLYKKAGFKEIWRDHEFVRFEKTK